MYRVVYVHDEHGHDDEGDRFGDRGRVKSLPKLDGEADGDTINQNGGW